VVEIASAIIEALTKAPLQGVASLIIFLLAMPIIIKGLRDRKEESHQPPPVPIQVESPWLVIELNAISATMQEMHREIRELAKGQERIKFYMESRKQ